MWHFKNGVQVLPKTERLFESPLNKTNLMGAKLRVDECETLRELCEKIETSAKRT